MDSILKHITIIASIPKGIAIGDLSRAFPDDEFRITNGHWVSENELILYITSDNWSESHTTYLLNHKDVLNLTQISSVVKIHIQSGFLEGIEKKTLNVIYPTKLQNGQNRIEFLIDHLQLSSLKSSLPKVKILKIADSYNVKSQITDRQKEILWKAYSFGYFEYPRKISLTDLAKLLKVSKATLSQTLRIVEKKAIKNLLESL